MTVRLQLDRDFLTGLGDFLDEAQKTYPEVGEVAKVLLDCDAPQWRPIKQNMPEHWDRPVFRNLANILEKALIAKSPRG